MQINSNKELVKAFMTKGIVAINEEKDVLFVAKKMVELDIGTIILVHKTGKVTGIVRDKDIVFKVVAEELEPSKIKAKNIAENVITIDMNATIDEALTKMAEESVDHLVVTSGNRIVGIFSIRDFIDLERHRYSL